MNDINNIYQQVLEGTMSPTIAKEKLNDQTVSPVSLQVIVTPENVSSLLNKFLIGEINPQQLSEWSSFLFLSDAYVNPDWGDDEKSDEYEPMWEILQQLSSPELDGKITTSRVQEHLATLDSLFP